MKAKKVLIWVGIGLVVAGGTFLAIRTFKKSKEDESSPDVLPTPEKIVQQTDPQGNDSFPLSIGSEGENVGYLQRALIRMGAKIVPDKKFGQNTYTALLLTKGLGTSYYPVTQDVFINILNKANSIK